ncbi:MAG: hypothetical protein ACTS78_00855 [Arsenophonus sp. NC-WZS1-MAG3]
MISIVSPIKIATNVIKTATVNFLPDEKAEDATNIFVRHDFISLGCV